MKKILFTGFTLALFLFAGVLHAQRPDSRNPRYVDSYGLNFGFRAGAFFGFHDISRNLDSDIYNSLTNFNFALYRIFPLSGSLFFQSELNFMIIQGIEGKGSVYTGTSGMYVNVSNKISYSSIDIPLLLKYCFLGGPEQLGFLGGLHLSLTPGAIDAEGINLASAEYSQGKWSYDSNIATFGFTAGLFAGIPAGQRRLTGDIRLIYDVNDLTIKEGGNTLRILKRRGLAVTAGFEF